MARGARLCRDDDAALTIAQRADAARNLPAVEKLSALLYDLTTGRHVPKDSDIEGRFSITKVESGRIWLKMMTTVRITGRSC